MKKSVLILLAALAAFFMFGREKTQIKNLGNPGETLVAFGDSLTYGHGAERERSYPAVLARKTSRSVVNLGLNGDTAAAAPRRLAEALAQNPYMVLIEFGGNDFMRGVPLEQSVAAVGEMVDAVQAAGAVAAVVDTGGYYGMKKYTKAYKKLAREKGAVFVPGILDGVFGRRGLMSDQIHPNARGYELVADKVYKAIEAYL